MYNTCTRDVKSLNGKTGGFFLRKCILQMLRGVQLIPCYRHLFHVVIILPCKNKSLFRSCAQECLWERQPCDHMAVGRVAWSQGGQGGSLVSMGDL